MANSANQTPETVESILRKRLRETREQLRLTQQQVGERIDKTGKSAGTTISAYEMGERKPGPVTLAKLAVALETTTDYLVGLTVTPERPYRKEQPSPETEEVSDKANQRPPRSTVDAVAVAKVWLAQLNQSLTHSRSRLDGLEQVLDGLEQALEETVMMSRGEIDSIQHQTSVLRQRFEQWFEGVEVPEASELLEMFQEVDVEERLRAARRGLARQRRAERAIRESETEQRKKTS